MPLSYMQCPECKHHQMTRIGYICTSCLAHEFTGQLPKTDGFSPKQAAEELIKRSKGKNRDEIMDVFDDVLKK